MSTTTVTKSTKTKTEQIYAPHPPGGPRDTARVALSLLLRDSKGGPADPASIRKQCRTKALLKHVHSISNLTDLAAEEKSLRSIIESNASRRFGQLQLAKLNHSHLLNNLNSVSFAEITERRNMFAEEEKVFFREMGFFAVLCGETTERHRVEMEYPPSIFWETHSQLSYKVLDKQEKQRRFQFLIPAESLQRECWIEQCYLQERMMQRHALFLLQQRQAMREEVTVLEKQQMQRLSFEAEELKARDVVEEFLMQEALLLYSQGYSARRFVQSHDVAGHESQERVWLLQNEVSSYLALMERQQKESKQLRTISTQTSFLLDESMQRMDLKNLEEEGWQKTCTDALQRWQELYNAMVKERGPRFEVESNEAFTRRDIVSKYFVDWSLLEERMMLMYEWVWKRDKARLTLHEEYVDGRLAVSRMENKEREALIRLRVKGAKEQSLEQERKVLMQVETEERRMKIEFEAWRFYFALSMEQRAISTVTLEQQERSQIGSYEMSARQLLNSEFFKEEKEATVIEKTAQKFFVEFQQHCEELFDATTAVCHGCYHRFCQRQTVRAELKNLEPKYRTLQFVLEGETNARERDVVKEQSSAFHGIRAQECEGAESCFRYVCQVEEVEGRINVYLRVLESAESTLRDFLENYCGDVLWDAWEEKTMDLEVIQRNEWINIEENRRQLIQDMRNLPIPALQWLASMESDEDKRRSTIEVEAEVEVNALIHMLPTSTHSRMDYRREVTEPILLPLVPEKSLLERIEERIVELQEKDELDQRWEIVRDNKNLREIQSCFMKEGVERLEILASEICQAEIVLSAGIRIGKNIENFEHVECTSELVNEAEVWERNQIDIESRAELLAYLEEYDALNYEMKLHERKMGEGSFMVNYHEDMNRIIEVENVARKKIRLLKVEEEQAYFLKQCTEQEEKDKALQDRLISSQQKATSLSRRPLLLSRHFPHISLLAQLDKDSVMLPWMLQAARKNTLKVQVLRWEGLFGAPNGLVKEKDNINKAQLYFKFQVGEAVHRTDVITLNSSMKDVSLLELPVSSISDGLKVEVVDRDWFSATEYLAVGMVPQADWEEGTQWVELVGADETAKLELMLTMK